MGIIIASYKEPIRKTKALAENANLLLKALTKEPAKKKNTALAENANLLLKASELNNPISIDVFESSPLSYRNIDDYRKAIYGDNGFDRFVFNAEHLPALIEQISKIGEDDEISARFLHKLASGDCSEAGEHSEFLREVFAAPLDTAQAKFAINMRPYVLAHNVAIASINGDTDEKA